MDWLGRGVGQQMHETELLDVQSNWVTDNFHTLAGDWIGLEEKAQPEVFLSWHWIGNWLRVYRPEVLVLRVWDRGSLVGMGLLCSDAERRHGVLVSRCLKLHQTGLRHQDQIWIEYNGFLAERGYEPLVARACVDHLLQHHRGWDELVLGASDREYIDELSRLTGLTSHIRWQAHCYGIDLQALRKEGSSYLASLSGNTRHQIRRAWRLYEETGALHLERPNTVAEALALFDAIGPWHLRRWGDGGAGSGYANAQFTNFHRQLIETQWEKSGVDLIVVKAGERTIALFYNLLYRRRVYFYLAGFPAENDNRLKPGLLGHALCVADYLERGFNYYDFMGGDERYKAQLGQQKGELVQAGLQRQRLKLRAEQTARRLKHCWLAP